MSAPTRRADPLTRDLSRILRPILGPASEKADLLVEHISRLHAAAPPDAAPRGLADAVKLLRVRYSDADIRAGANSLLADLAARYSTRETVT